MAGHQDGPATPECDSAADLAADDQARDFTDSNELDPVTGRLLEMCQRVLEAIETGNPDTIAREIDWVTSTS